MSMADWPLPEDQMRLLREQNADLKAKLAQVEADAAEMRMLIEEVKQVCNALSRQFDMRYLLGRCELILSTGSGQRLLDELTGAKEELDERRKEAQANADDMLDLRQELSTLRATAKRRLELLRKLDVFPCPICGGGITSHGSHKPTCPLAQELKEGK